MAITVENVQTATETTSYDLVITKPTGLAEGDLLVAVIASAGSMGTPAGWTVRATVNQCDVFSKVADAGDVAASNFTFTATGSFGHIGALYRISGFAPTTPGFYEETGSDTILNNGSTTTLSTACSITPVSNESLVIMAAHTWRDNDSDYATFADWALTGGTSPTFTERIDTKLNINAPDDTVGLAVADGTYSGTTEITNFEVIATEFGNDTHTAYHLILVINAAQDASGSAALLTTTPVFFTETVSVGTSGSAALLETTPTVNDASGATKHHTRWTNEEKPSTTWTNEDKL